MILKYNDSNYSFVCYIFSIHRFNLHLKSNRSIRLVIEKESKSVSIDLVTILLTDQSYIEFYETKYDIKDAIEGYEYFQ
jgi:hypothetical protein